MEEIIDFDNWVAVFAPADIQYYAAFNPVSGQVIGIFPEHACNDILNKIKIDDTLAADVFSGKLPLASCSVDLLSDTVEITKNSVLIKIDDILHRVPDRKFSNIIKPDIKIIFSEGKNKFKFILASHVSNQRVKWDGHTILKFIITEYNDPHKIVQVVEFTLAQLISANRTKTYTGASKNFSVFTTRIFKNYILEKK